MLVATLVATATALLHVPAMAPRMTPLRMFSAAPEPDLSALIDEALRLTEHKGEADRQNAVVLWVPSERQRLSDELSDLLSERAAKIQTTALAAHERGEDVSEASNTLQTIVDMTVQT